MDMSIVWEHLFLVFMSVIFSLIIGLPLGILAYLKKPVRKIILWIVEILQTIPALALLGLIMIIFGAGKLTVIIGLILYSLLPIVKNTYIRLEKVDSGIKEAGKGMGMTQMDRLISVGNTTNLSNDLYRHSNRYGYNYWCSDICYIGWWWKIRISYL